ncbi:hypothetical protein HCN44_005466 [Aphidius gifuensis]|uniref:DNA-directed RNA polymerase subunit beta n=1 Tax=Aphidius gifuensis TaxID=684658 RepID=A0A835CVF7_APHGI|nr:DNA-directed RNA polymerase I subunit RPA2 [Aphidius gifuensis]KAF7997189.1 hypothetical protein HCN44_005466 [Aphidius gifuensis]
MKLLDEPVLSNLHADYGKHPDKQNPSLQALGEPHVNSFNYMLDNGLDDAIKDILPVHLKLKNGDKIKLWIADGTIDKPRVLPVSNGTKSMMPKNTKYYPSECRQRASTYKGKFTIKVGWSIDDQEQEFIEKDLGEIPIMVKSNRCHLLRSNPEELVKYGEHEQEWGGYFVVKGHERLIRMLLLQRANYPIALRRSGWKGRGSLFSDLGLSIKCTKDDHTSTTNTLHYVTNGTAKLNFMHNKSQYYIPIVMLLKALVDVSDKIIYDALIAGNENDIYYKGCVANMLREIHDEGLHTHERIKRYIGKIFRIKLPELSEDSTDIEVCNFILKYCIAIHLDDPQDKFNLFVYMTKKLFTLINEKCIVEGTDSVMMQECLLGGHLYLQTIKERLFAWLQTLRLSILKRQQKQCGIGDDYKMTVHEMLMALKMTSKLEHQMENFLSTGNIKTVSGLGLMQTTGLTIVAENINRMRYMSHFRAIHRGSFFQEMRTTEARQLLPDAWGFICPVHTPDGAPCGLLNHLTNECVITKHPNIKLRNNIPQVLVDLGMTPLSLAEKWNTSYTVMLDGRIIGLIEDNIVSRIVDKLRMLKIAGKKVPNMMEIVFICKKKVRSQYPGLFLFTGPSRMMRPVINLIANKIEYIGTFEQVYLDICIKTEEAHEKTTHREIKNTNFLSNLASLIPMPDCNQSPRNMYQCQMGKQTMGTPCHTWHLQAETKLYRLQTPATPLFRPVHYDNIQLDDFAMGTNAIIAVISYTGYDMEDAMIINKASYDRGFAHGMIYKSEFVRLKNNKSYFMRDPEKKNLSDTIATDGLPVPGTKIKPDDPYYCMFNDEEKKFIIGKYSGKEDVHVENVRLCGTRGDKSPGQACITFRLPRNPTIGDKFASRAGQKGICSKLQNPEDLPFTESGMVPDVVFNPHGFPSRMTIAMMIELIAGKSAAIDGKVYSATPFKFNEKNTAIDHFSELLKKVGYNHFGTEQMYSGFDGRLMKADIFFGIVHYQRLRHMVSDKWQVRSTGPIDALTRQPLKGRRRGGGVRFGEMERDSLLSHGCPYLLQDRLFHCSDKTSAMICGKCGTLLGPIAELVKCKERYENKQNCRLCNDDRHLKEIDIPYIYKFLVTQLASCNIKVKSTLNDI